MNFEELFPIEDVDFGIKNKSKKHKNVNSIIINLLGEKAIAFNPVLGRMSGNATSGLFMSQLLYWQGKGRKKEYIYKTIEEFKKETCLTRSEQERAIRNWSKLGVLEVKNKGTPPIRHFKVSIEKLAELLCLSTSNTEELQEMSDNLQKKTNQFAD